MGINYTPTFEKYNNLKGFKFWCQKVLPAVYDDSLSYYELLCKVVDYLNLVIEDVLAVEDNVGALLEAYNLLQTWVNDYFDNLDVQEEINNKLDNMADSGELFDLIRPFIELTVTQTAENWLDENVVPTGSTVMVDKSLTISGAAADAKVTGVVRDNVENFGAYNIYTDAPTDERVINGVTWRYANNRYQCSGTAVAESVYDLFNDPQSIPPWLKKTRTYVVKCYSNYGSWIELKIAFYKGGVPFKTININGSVRDNYNGYSVTEFTVPVDTVGCSIQLVNHATTEYANGNIAFTFQNAYGNYDGYSLLKEMAFTGCAPVNINLNKAYAVINGKTWIGSTNNVADYTQTAADEYVEQNSKYPHGFWSATKSTSGESVYTLVESPNSMPDPIKPGASYYVNAKKFGAINLIARYFKNGVVYSDENWTPGSNNTLHKVTIPSDAQGLGLYLTVGTAATYNINLGIFNTMTNAQIVDRVDEVVRDMSFTNQYFLPTGTDLNDVNKCGYAVIGSSSQYYNNPLDPRYNGYLITLPSKTGVDGTKHYVQFAVGTQTNDVFWRYQNNGTYLDWIKLNGGENAEIWLPDVSENGIISWTKSSADAPPAPQNIRGVRGASGADGVSPNVTITNITNGHRVRITDASHPSGQTFDVMDGAKGDKGEQGAAGQNGVSPNVTITPITNGNQIRITDASHPAGQVFTVMNGENGAKGEQGEQGVAGQNGVSPNVTITEINDGTRVTITDADHPQGQTFDVLNGSSDGSVFVATYGVTTAQQILAYINSGKTIAPVAVKRGNDYFAALITAKKADNAVYVRTLGSISGVWYIFDYTVTNGTWSVVTTGLQKVLESGVNIKSINGNSLLGSGNLQIVASERYVVGEEVLVGEWVEEGVTYDLYRKVVHFGDLPNTQTLSVAHGITNKVKFTKVTGVAASSSNTLPLPFSATTSQYNIYVGVGNSNITITTEVDRSAYDAYITLEFIRAR